jgi:hypothetical protein
MLVKAKQSKYWVLHNCMLYVKTDHRRCYIALERSVEGVYGRVDEARDISNASCLFF